ncbi:MAG: hypothetical protein L3J03_00265 [Desulfobacterales bacterium]|nr:hypothetical protein [Desulfobacterales bacterium]
MAKNILIIALLAFCTVAATAGPVQSEEMLTLVVRPELLDRTERSTRAPVPSRNIFAWPAEKSMPADSRQRQADESALAAMKKLRAEAILWNRSKPLAIINGRLIGVGDEFSGIRVLAIHRDSITLAKGPTRHVIGFETTEINLGTGSEP